MLLQWTIGPICSMMMMRFEAELAETWYDDDTNEPLESETLSDLLRREMQDEQTPGVSDGTSFFRAYGIATAGNGAYSWTGCCHGGSRKWEVSDTDRTLAASF